MRIKNILQKTIRFKEYIAFKCRSLFTKKRTKSAIVLLDNIVVPRKLYQLCTLLVTSKFTVYVKINLKEYLRFNYIGRLIFNNKHVHMVLKTISNADLIVTDTEDTLTPLPGQKTLKIDYQFFPPDYYFFKENCYFPIMYHPRLMSEESYEYGRQLSTNNDRKVRVLFAGNLDPSRYDSEIIKTQFGVNTRAEVIGWITQSDKMQEYVYQPRTFEQFFSDMQENKLKDKIVIINTMECEIPQNRWLELLSQVDFFIMVPGLTHPFCHNMAESMSTGAIPILQYPQFFYPVLVHGKNCLTFDTDTELEGLLRNVVTTVDNELIEEMRQNVVEYHEKYMSLNGFKSCIESFIKGEKKSIRLIMARRLPG